MKICADCPSPAKCKAAGKCMKGMPLPKSKPPKNVRPNHPMNTERTTGLKMDPQYKSSGGMVFKGRS